VKFPLIVTFSKPADGRGWVGCACFALTLIILLMIWEDRALLHDDFFKVIATAIILTAWNNGPVGWAYQATKSGGELAAGNAALVKRQAEASPPLDGSKE
jgi:hypothetical protein